ncbi:hypothetical protein JNW88_12225 [Micromonospora sp. ATA32]|nr:hypothetical protein [Micromonospora sp. ATA32]
MADDRLGGRRAPRTDDRGRVPFVWVEDTDTGHRYDVLETALRDGMKPVDDVELNYTGRARKAKYRVDLAGNDATRTPDQSGTDTPESDGDGNVTTTTASPAAKTRGARS